MRRLVVRYVWFVKETINTLIIFLATMMTPNFCRVSVTKIGNQIEFEKVEEEKEEEEEEDEDDDDNEYYLKKTEKEDETKASKKSYYIQIYVLTRLYYYFLTCYNDVYGKIKNSMSFVRN